MPISWPGTLQNLLNEESFSFKSGDTAIRSDMDTGPAKVRRRFTRSIDQVTGTINLTTSQFTTFETFFDTTLNGGVNVFQFNHPITGALTDFRFIGTYQVSSIGGGNFRVTFTWEMV